MQTVCIGDTLMETICMKYQILFSEDKSGLSYLKLQGPFF